MLLVAPGLDSQKMWRRIENEEIGRPTTRALVCMRGLRFLFARRRNELASTKCESFGVGGGIVWSDEWCSAFFHCWIVDVSLEFERSRMTANAVLYWTTPLAQPN